MGSTHVLGTFSGVYSQLYTAIMAATSASAGLTFSKNTFAPGCSKSSHRNSSGGIGQLAFGSLGGGRGAACKGGIVCGVIV